MIAFATPPAVICPPRMKKSSTFWVSALVKPQDLPTISMVLVGSSTGLPAAASIFSSRAAR